MGLKAQRDGLVWLGVAKAGCKLCLLLFEIVTVALLQGKQNQILLRKEEILSKESTSMAVPACDIVKSHWT